MFFSRLFHKSINFSAYLFPSITINSAIDVCVFYLKFSGVSTNPLTSRVARRNENCAIATQFYSENNGDVASLIRRLHSNCAMPPLRDTCSISYVKCGDVIISMVQYVCYVRNKRTSGDGNLICIELLMYTWINLEMKLHEYPESMFT